MLEILQEQGDELILLVRRNLALGGSIEISRQRKRWTPRAG